MAIPNPLPKLSFRQLILVFFSVVVGGIIISVILGQQQLSQLKNNDANTSQALDGQLSSDVVSEDVTLTVTNGPAKQWELTAKTAVYDRTQTQAALGRVSGTFYGSDETPIATFTAPRGRYDDTTKAVTLLADDTQSAKVTGTDPETPMGLTAPKITWSSRNDLVTASGGALLHLGENLVSRGEQAEFTLDFTEVRLSGQAETLLAGSDD